MRATAQKSAPNVTVLTERGQVSVPAKLRAELSLEAGQRLLWEKVGDRELRVFVLEPSQPAGAQAMRGFAKRFRKPRRSDEWMRILREGED